MGDFLIHKTNGWRGTRSGALLILALLAAQGASGEFLGCNVLRWSGLNTVVWLAYGLPQPVCVDDPLDLSVKHYYGWPDSYYGCIYQDYDCDTSTTSPVTWNLDGGVIVDFGCAPLTQIEAVWSNTGIHNVSAEKNTPGGYIPVAYTVNPPQMQVGVFALAGVLVTPETVAPGGQAVVIAWITPTLDLKCTRGVALSARGVDNTGGHQHAHLAGGTPHGAFEDDFPCFTTSGCLSGLAWTNYTAGAFSQEEIITASICGLDMECSLTVQVPGLVELGAGEHHTLVGQTAIHPRNHYITASGLTKLQALAAEWHSSAGQPLGINDCSLRWGGKFELTPWNAALPHSTHRDGTNADIAVVSPNPTFEAICRRQTIEYYAEGSYYHLKDL